MVSDLDLDVAGRPRTPVVVIDTDRGSPPGPGLAITVAVAHERPVPVEVADVVIASPGLCAGAVETEDPDAEAALLVRAIEGSPIASLTLVWLLRAPAGPTTAALAAESAAYSTLLGGADFRAWLADRPTPRPSDDGDRVRLERISNPQGDVLRITLTRAARRNAVDRRLRDELVDALQVAAHDPNLLVEIDAEGPAFSAGGDLDEFGTATDLALAHIIRTGAGAGRLLDELRDRVTVHLHGTCIGAGIELPAFAGRITATPDTTFGLPEVAMGLIPGAGGTVSIPRRIGRGRTLWWAITGSRLDAATALRWGLVDELR